MFHILGREILGQLVLIWIEFISLSLNCPLDAEILDFNLKTKMNIP